MKTILDQKIGDVAVISETTLESVDALCQKLIDKYESGEWIEEPLLVDRLKGYLRRVAQREKDRNKKSLNIPQTKQNEYLQ